MRELKGHSLLDFPDSYTIIDVETTGLDPAKDSLIEVAALKINNNEVIDSYSSLINPGFPISSFISELTGITNDQLATSPDAKNVLPTFYNFIGEDILVGHNVHFDINFLYDNFTKYLGNACSNDFVDTLRLSKKYYKGAKSYRLTSLAQDMNISVDTSHRALADCETTHQLYIKLEDVIQNIDSLEIELLDTLIFDASNPFYGKKIVVKGLPQLYSYTFMKKVAEKCQADMGDIFFKSCDYIVFSEFTYKKYKYGEYSAKFEKADKLADEGSLTILSEKEWYKMLNIPVPIHHEPSAPLSAKDITSNKTDFDETHPLYGKLCVFTGTLAKMQRKDAMQEVVDVGGLVGNGVTSKTNYLILGNNDYCLSIKDGKSNKQKKAESLKLAGKDIDVISEDVFYDMLNDY